MYIVDNEISLASHVDIFPQNDFRHSKGKLDDCAMFAPLVPWILLYLRSGQSPYHMYNFRLLLSLFPLFNPHH